MSAENEHQSDASQQEMKEEAAKEEEQEEERAKEEKKEEAAKEEEEQEEEPAKEEKKEEAAIWKAKEEEEQEEEPVINDGKKRKKGSVTKVEKTKVGAVKEFIQNIGSILTRNKRERIFKVTVFAALLYTINYMMTGYDLRLYVSLIGFIFPAVMTWQVVSESNLKENINVELQWATYWVVYAALEIFTDILLSWLPLYYLCKCWFFIWCMFRGREDFNGAIIIRERVFRPIYTKHTDTIEKVLTRIGLQGDAAGPSNDQTPVEAKRVGLVELSDLLVSKTE